MLLTSLSGRTFDGDGASPPPDMKVDVHPPHGVMIPMGKCSHMVGLKKSIHIMESKKKLHSLPPHIQGARPSLA